MNNSMKAASIRPTRAASAVSMRHSSWDFYHLLLLGLILVYVVIFARLAFAQHLGMRTHKADLGQIDQAVWNSSRGRFVEMTDNGFVATRLTDHVEPILALISPIFWLWDDVRALLLLQVIVVALGAWPLYELALLRLDQLLSPSERLQIWHSEPLRQLTRPIALTLALAYLLAPQLQSAVLTEFHAAPLAAPLILWAFWAIETRHWQQFVVATLLVASVKEETALLAAGLGVWAIWRLILANLRLTKPLRYPLLLASFVTLISLVWFYLATFVIVPAYAQQVYHGAESVYFQRYGALGNSPLDIFKSFVTQPSVVWRIASEPARLHYLWALLAAFGFFSLLAPEILLLALPVLLANLLSAYPAQYYGEFHYSAPIVPCFVVSALYGVARLWVWLGRRVGQSSTGFQHMPAASAGMMAVVAFFRNSRTTLRPLLATLICVWLLLWAGQLYRVAGRGPLGERYDPTPITAHDRLLARFMAQLPSTAAVTATAAVHPHVSHRRYVYQFPIGLEAPGQADWALLDVTTNTDMAPGDLKTRVDQLLAGDWGVVDAVDGFLLLHKGVPAKTIPDAFYTFARAPATDEKNLSDVSLQSQSVTVADWSRWRQTKVITRWVVGKKFDPATSRPDLKIITPADDLLFSYSQATPPALVWYPPARWHVGEVIQITSPPLTLPRIWGVVVEQAQQTTLVAAYQRLDQGTLWPIPLHGNPAAPEMSRATSAQLRIVDQRKAVTNLDLQATLSSQPVWPGGRVELWLQWGAIPTWPSGDSVFVHLRRQNVNLVQSDGPPRFFGSDATSISGTQQPVLRDLRQLIVPANVLPGETLTVVIGLYNPQTGQRADVLDANGNVTGNELVIGQLMVGPPPVPDQACALVAQACDSQPVP
ncbi:hypothetical protein BH10CHL1_BH10CHL1_09810 [soil metagenome]